MFGVFECSGKQHRVAKGDIVKLDKLPQEIGEKIAFDNVLCVTKGESVVYGRPYVDGAKVEVEVLEHGRSPKIRVVKFKRRKGYLRQAGHRQDFTKVRVLKISP